MPWITSYLIGGEVIDQVKALLEMPYVYLFMSFFARINFLAGGSWAFSQLLRLMLLLST
jgi:hypothetical protein